VAPPTSLYSSLYIKKHVVINVQYKDDHYLQWAGRSALFPATRRPTWYPINYGLDLNGIDAPIFIYQFRWSKKTYLFGWDKDVIVHCLSKQHEDMPRFNLLLIEKAGTFHNTWIKDFSREG